MSERLSAGQIYGYARGAGFDHEESVRFTAIALAESGGRPGAIGDVALQNGTWGPSVGLWQVRSLNSEKGSGGTRDQLANLDPAVNARAAYEISNGGRTMQPWSTAHSTDSRQASYVQYLDDARAGAADFAGSGVTLDRGGAVQAAAQAAGPGERPDRVRPVEDATLTDTWGAPRSGGRRHEGIDMFADQGTPIHAVSGGRIVKGFHNDIGGVVVRIEGDDGRYYYYAHLEEGSVDHLQIGQRVATGDVIGRVGNTGDASSTPAHLHLQVREDGAWINPYHYLQPLPEWNEAGQVTTAVAAEADPQADAPADPPPHTCDGSCSAGVATALAMPAGAEVAAAVDTDEDGLTDEFERLLGTNLQRVDTDGDGLSDAFESSVSHSDPLSADTDGDGVTDGVAVARGLDPGKVALPAAARDATFGGLATLDTDGDGLTDEQEARAGLVATKADSDGDGLTDGFEVARGLNPLSIDSDHDGLTDGFAVERSLVPAATAPATAPPGATVVGVDPVLAGAEFPVGAGAGVPGADAAGSGAGGVGQPAYDPALDPELASDHLDMNLDGGPDDAVDPTS